MRENNTSVHYCRTTTFRQVQFKYSIFILVKVEFGGEVYLGSESRYKNISLKKMFLAIIRFFWKFFFTS